MNLKLIVSSLVAVLAAVSLSGCGSENASGSADVEMSIGTGGLILPVSQQTCVDKIDGSNARSAKENSLNMGAFSFLWVPKNRQLFIGTISLTLRSARIAGGTQTFFIGGDELEGLLGAVGQTITPINDDLTLGNKRIISTSPTNRNSAPACAFVIGGIKFADPTIKTPFTANITLELIGTSSGSDADPADQSNPQLVRETFLTTAQFPGI